jgi:hypothetical protein
MLRSTIHKMHMVIILMKTDVFCGKKADAMFV